MSQQPISDEDLKSYLLGTMPPPACAALEDRYLSDDDTYERLQAIEEELIDQRARGLLPRSQRAYFEGHLLLSNDGLERLRFARALAQLHSHRRQSIARRLANLLRSNRGALGLAAVSAVALLACAILWRDFRSESVRPQSTHLTNVLANESMTKSPPRGNHAPSPSVTLFLRSLSRDKSPGNILRVPSGYAHVVLEAETPGDVQNSYHVTIQRVDADDATLQTPTNIIKRAAQSGTIIVSAEFPPEFFRDGAYIFTISMETGHHSSEEIIAYEFSVVNTPTS